MRKINLVGSGLTFDDVLMEPQYNPIESRSHVDISGFLGLKTPVISSNMDTITETAMANWMHENGGLGALHRFMDIQRNIDQYKMSPQQTFVSLGVTKSELERAEALFKAGATNFMLDIAHAHSESARNAIKAYKEMFGNNAHLMAGTVATIEGAAFLAEAGADSIRVGIGGGSVCSTRIKTGFGVPQLSAIAECSFVGRPIIADGGCRSPGDIAKALAAGASAVILGGMLSGTYYTPGSIELTSNGAYKSFRGMASKEVAIDKLGGLAGYRAAEGVQVRVKSLSEQESNEIIQDIIGGLRSAFTYAGAKNLEEFQKKVVFIKVSGNVINENKPHKQG